MQETIKKEFNADRCQRLADQLTEVVNANGDALAVEKVYAVAAVLRGLGEAMYDRRDKSHDAVLADYTDSPNWPAALILVADLPHEILDLMAREKVAPELNAQLWKEHGERIKNGNN